MNPRQRKRILAALLLTPVLAFGVCVGGRRLWWRDAEAAIAATVASVGSGGTPSGIIASVRGDRARVPARDFRETYELTGADNYLAGTSLLDCMSPGVLVAHARFRNGSTYHVEAQRIQGTWHVHFQPAEDGND